MSIEIQYLETAKDIIENGISKDPRNGIVKSLFGRQLIHDFKDGFPLLTTKKLHWKSIAVELIWFLRGDTNIKYLHDYKVSIWDEWADKEGNLGPVYGRQWRKWEYFDVKDQQIKFIDQIKNVINDIEKNPFSRRLIVSAWNPAEIEKMALPPCHCLFQFYVRPDNNGKPEYLDLQLYQRSADWGLGAPFNIASYALLNSMIAQQTNLKPGRFIYTLGDLHVYNNHINQLKIQIEREPRQFPTLEFKTNKKDIFNIEFEDIEIKNYNPHPHIKMEVSK